MHILLYQNLSLVDVNVKEIYIYPHTYVNVYVCVCVGIYIFLLHSHPQGGDFDKGIYMTQCQKVCMKRGQWC